MTQKKSDKNNFKPFPKPPSLWKLLGPSFLVLALGLGSGEVILWPYLVANFGLGVCWGALLGITFQYFINMEIERYALVRGESVFVGIAKYFRWAPHWFIASTFIGFGLPGIIAASSQVIASVFGLESYKWLAIFLLIFIGVILSSGKSVYDMMEKLTKTVILIGVPTVLVLAVMSATPEGWLNLGRGLVGQGEGFWFLPEGIAIASFLAAFAYSGAGGNLNLTQSIYIKERGYGMGKYAQKITGLFQAKTAQDMSLEGAKFELNSSNLEAYKKWWQRISLEHLLVFWGMGLITMLLLMLLAYSTSYGQSGVEEGINFVLTQGESLTSRFGPAFGLVFLLISGLMLFQTQLGITDSTSRIMAENVALIKLKGKTTGKLNLSKYYAILLWSQIAFGGVLLFNSISPKDLIVLGAVINAVGMFVHIGLVNFTNLKTLPKETRPAIWRRVILLLIFIFFGLFSTFVLWNGLLPYFEQVFERIRINLGFTS